MTQQPKISVIVPVYSVEPYLDHCVKSIVDQTYQKLEIILVDDGSPDNCPAMCDAWAKKDDRIRVIHQENAGGGPARNAGLDIATGELIGFIDSDDYIAPQMYEYLYRLMDEKIDIAECSILMTETDQALFEEQCDLNYQIYSTEEALSLHIRDILFKQTPPNKLYRRHTLEHVRFPSGTKIDDEFFTYKVLGNARKLVHIDCPLYAYRQQAGSLMHSMGSKRRMEAIEAKLQRHQYLEECFPSLVDESLKNLWFTCLYQGQLALREMPPSAAREALSQISGTLKICPLNRKQMQQFSPKERLWLNLTQVSFNFVCRLRNNLKIGI